MLNSEKGLVKGVVCRCYNGRGIVFLSVVLVFWNPTLMGQCNNA